jgi:hypothetical protein
MNAQAPTTLECKLQDKVERLYNGEFDPGSG